MRYSMVIVDDEKYSRNGIAGLISWSDYGIDIIGSADSGISGIELINSLRPDIVLTDVNMKAMDGFEMIRRLREMDINSKFIVISGYKLFEYAKKAIEEGVFSYLLKPVTREELIPIIEKVKQVIKAEQQNKGLSEMGRHEEYLKKLFEGEGKIEEGYSTYYIKYDGNLINSLHQKNKLFTILEEKLGNAFISFVNNDDMVILTDARPLSVEYSVNEALLEIAKGKAYIGVSPISDDYKNSLKRSELALRYHMYESNSSMINYNDIASEDDKVFLEALLGSRTDNITTAIEQLNLAAAYGLLDEACDLILKKRPHPGEIEVWLGYLLMFIKNWSKRMGVSFIECLKTQDQQKFYNNVGSVLKMDKLSSTLKGIIKNAVDAVGKQRQLTSDRGVKAVISYIDDHYLEDISLEHLEKIFFTDLSYLSRLIKKETGVSYLQYLTDKRIKRAKELLSDQSLQLYKIANMVGYTDAKYFSQLFKKMTGVTPSEYRDIIINRGE